MRIIIAADNASTRFGGEAFIPLNYFRLLLARQEDVLLVVHARNRSELTELFPDDINRIHFVDDTALHKGLVRFGAILPRRLADATTGLSIHLSTQLAQRRLIRELTKKGHSDVVHIPIPVSPKTPSLMWGLQAAVVIGPLNGGMNYPDAFRRERSPISRLSFSLGRWLAHFANIVIPGKLRAEVILVANRRTRDALPRGIAGQVIQLVENGVDFSVWKSSASRKSSEAIRLIFVGRLIDWKALDIVFEAMGRIRSRIPISLEVIGDGPMREHWQASAREMGLGPAVEFTGWLSQQACADRMQQSDVFVLPSLFECGGSVVLEAMAMGLPVIATRWGGPTDYLDDSCGVLVTPSSREALVAGFAEAMERLALSPELRDQMGQSGKAHAKAHFDWNRKVDQILEVYHTAATHRASAAETGRQGTRFDKT
jgi:glycosyltransferase involved in cell wall biosynthesis